MKNSEEKEEIILEGIAGSPGVAHGPAYLYLHEELDIPSYCITKDEIEGELSRFDQAIVQTRQEISKIRDEVALQIGEEEARIFDAHQLVLEDKSLLDETIRDVKEKLINIEYCFHEVANRYIEVFSKIDDEFIRERVTDIKDVTRRLIGNLLGDPKMELARHVDGSIIVGKELTPSDTAGFQKGKVTGIVTDMGGRTGHAVIMARSIEVPAVVGLHNVTERVKPGDMLLVDGYDGVVIINPSEHSLYHYGKIKTERQHLKEVFLSNINLEPKTKDGKHLSVLANIEGVEDTVRAKEYRADGVGLFRTESIFLSGENFLSEDEQFEAYRNVVESMNPASTIIRTLDLGGDKAVNDETLQQHAEENPFMGFRAIRFCLERPDVFKTQIRAILRASAFGNAKIMYPMVSVTKELIQANHILEECKEELRVRKQDFDENIKIGSMIETPSAGLTVDLLADHCDFFSIGTNDLIQYMFAVDRVNEHVAHLYMPNHPAVMRFLKSIIDGAKSKNTQIGICGEMAGDPLFLPVLFGLGLDSISVTPSVLPEAKYLIRQMKFTEAQALAEQVLNSKDPRTVIDLLRKFYFEKMGKVLEP